MFKKKIASGDVFEDRPQTEFPKQTKFARDSRIWKVIEEIEDTTEVWRRVMADTGEEELVTLTTLKRDLAAGALSFIKNN